MAFTQPVDPVVSGESLWRAAVLAVHVAQTRYLDLLQSAADVDERTIELAWLDLYRAEQRRDSILYRIGP